MKVKVKTLTQEIYEVTTEVDTAVSAFKEEIKKIREGEPEEIKLIYAGKILDDQKKLGDYEIKDGDCVVGIFTKAVEDVEKEEDEASDDEPAEDCEGSEPDIDIPTNIDGLLNTLRGDGVARGLLTRLLADVLLHPTPNIQLTDEDNGDIEELVNITGASRQDAIQYYIQCGRDKNVAINMLLDNMCGE